MMKQIVELLKKINTDYIFYLLLLGYFVFSIFFSTFRDAIKDETIYIQETYLMAELIRDGIWFGNYAVGLHGFLSKIPPALVFIFTGPSVWILTIYNILIGVVVLYLFYNLLKKIFEWQATALLVTGVLMVNFHFILSTPTYLREMPSLLAVMLLFYGIFRYWKPWVLGLIFLLILDSKEYLFFMFGLGYFVWIALKYFKLHASLSLLEKVKNIIWESLQVFGFSLVWIILMFTTSLIPVNMFLASIIGIIDSGSGYLLNHFSTDRATANLLLDEGAREVSGIRFGESSHPVIQVIVDFVNKILAYFGKIVYPRTFSFLSIPKVILLPSLYMMVRLFKDTLKQQKNLLNNPNLIFPILSFVYLLVYLLRASHGRYLFPIVPVIAIYFVYFLYYKYHDKRSLYKVLLGTFVFVLIGFVFEVTYVPIKVLLETLMFACIAIAVLEPFKFPKEFYILFRKFTLGVCLLAMFSASVAFAYAQGQVQRSILLGQNREIDQIVEVIPEGGRFWVNNYDSHRLMAVYIEQTYEWPEWKWDLHPLVPKRHLLQARGEQYLYNERWGEISDFKGYLNENDIRYVVLMKSTTPEHEFEFQDQVSEFKSVEWLNLKRIKDLTNKEIYLFKVSWDEEIS